MKITDNFDPIPGIYILRNIVNGKYYIGETKNMKGRMRNHSKHHSQLIHYAIKKYGVQNFEVYIEYLPNFNKSDRVGLEEELIKKFDCLAPKGYNLCWKDKNRDSLMSDSVRMELKEIRDSKKGKKTGPPRGIFKHTEESKKKIAESGRGRIVSKETGLKISESKKRNMTPEIKEKMSKSRKGYVHPPSVLRKMAETNKKPILQIDLKTGEIIKEWPSAQDATLFLTNGKTKSGYICHALSGRDKSSLGFKWKYK